MLCIDIQCPDGEFIVKLQVVVSDYVTWIYTCAWLFPQRTANCEEVGGYFPLSEFEWDYWGISSAYSASCPDGKGLTSIMSFYNDTHLHTTMQCCESLLVTSYHEYGVFTSNSKSSAGKGAWYDEEEASSFFISDATNEMAELGFDYNRTEDTSESADYLEASCSDFDEPVLKGFSFYINPLDDSNAANNNSQVALIKTGGDGVNIIGLKHKCAYTLPGFVVTSSLNFSIPYNGSLGILSLPDEINCARFREGKTAQPLFLSSIRFTYDASLAKPSIEYTCR